MCMRNGNGYDVENHIFFQYFYFRLDGDEGEEFYVFYDNNTLEFDSDLKFETFHI